MAFLVMLLLLQDGWGIIDGGAIKNRLYSGHRSSDEAARKESRPIRSTGCGHDESSNFRYCRFWGGALYMYSGPVALGQSTRRQVIVLCAEQGH